MSTSRIRQLKPADIDAVVEFSLRAWAPVFASFEQVLGSAIYQRIFPDWAPAQAAAVRQVCANEAAEVWVTERAGTPVGFMALVVHGADHSEPNSAEIEMIAVDPDHQRHGLAAELIAFGVERMRAAGCALAVIATGGDPGHRPARLAYEKAGFTPLPQVRYYQAL